MVVFQIAEILINDKPTKNNKELIDFLGQNLRSAIIKGQLKFRFHKISKKKDPIFQKYKVTKLPTMILDNENYTGVQKIIEEVKHTIKRSRTVAASKTNEEILDDFQKQMMNDGVSMDDKGKFVVPKEDENGGDDGDNENLAKVLNQRAMEEAKRRGINVASSGRDDERQNNTRMKPSRKPDRDFGYDEDDDDAPPKRSNPKQRGNNVDPSDMKTIIKQQKITSVEDLKDQDMMMQLMDNLASSIDD